MIFSGEYEMYGFLLMSVFELCLIYHVGQHDVCNTMTHSHQFVQLAALRFRPARK